MVVLLGGVLGGPGWLGRVPHVGHVSVGWVVCRLLWLSVLLLGGCAREGAPEAQPLQEEGCRRLSGEPSVFSSLGEPVPSEGLLHVRDMVFDAARQRLFVAGDPG